MARIPEAELEALKSQVDLVALIRSKGVELKKHGKDLVGRCPFHNDKTPSLVVTPGKNLWHCLGACQMGGSVIDWIMKSHQLSFRQAVETLKSGNLNVLLSPKKSVRTAANANPSLPSPVDSSADDAKTLRQVVEFYHQALKQSGDAMAYLKHRGIDSSDAIEKFKLGHCDRTLGFRLKTRSTAEGAEVRDRMARLGLMRESGHELFAGSIVIPVVGLDGQVTEIYGRKTARCMTREAVRHLYLPGPHRGVWNPEGVREAKGEVILCEALIDALSFWVNGFHNVTASYGVEGFTADHLAAFIDSGVRRVMIAYDRDEAGDRAAEKLAEKLASEGIESWRVRFPKGMDANDYFRKVKPPAQALRVCLESAELLSKPKRLAVAAAPSNAKTPIEVCEAEPSPSRFFSLAASPSAPAAAPAVVAAPVTDGTAPLLAEPQATSGVSITPPPPAAPQVPKLSFTSLEIPAEQRGEDWFLFLGDRKYRVRGLAKNATAETLRINLRVGFEMRHHVDQLDLYQAKARAAFTHQASRELGLDVEMIQRDLGRVLLNLEELQAVELEKRRSAAGKTQQLVELGAEEKREALALLRAPDLLERIAVDFDRCGVVGEKTNKLAGYLAAVSRKLEEPLAVIIQSSSSAGKSSLMEAVLAMIPSEDKVRYSAMTGQSLFYIGESNLKHRILAIAEEEGASRAAYALKLLQSEGEISIASTGKDPQSGRLVTQEYRVEGPVMIFLTTTAIDFDEELLNRCLVLTVDEDRAQTRAIHEKQRESRTLAGFVAREERAQLLKLHQNAQRLLRSLKVINPFAERLTFQDSRTRMRRDHKKYLALIDAVALLHQYQREVKEVVGPGGEVIEYIEVELHDVETANRLCHEILGRSLDELAPQTRRLLVAIDSLVTETGAKRAEIRFTRKQVREYCGWSLFQVQKHVQRLVEHEYVIPHRGARGSSFVYELMYDGGGADGKPSLLGLIDSKTLGGSASAHELSQELPQKLKPLEAELKPPCSAPENGSQSGEAAKKGESDVEEAQEGSQTQENLSQFARPKRSGSGGGGRS